MKRYNIFYVNNFSSDHTGSPKWLLNTVRSIKRDMFRPIISVPEPGPLFDRAQELGIQTEIISTIDLSKETIFLFMLNAMKHIVFLAKQKIDIVHLNYLGWRDSIVLSAKILNIPVVLHVHNNPGSSSAIKKSLNVYLADKIIAVSKYTRGFLNTSEKVWKKSVFIYNAIDNEAFSQGRSIRHEFKIRDDEYIVGIVGQICERKGIKYFIQMASYVLQELKNVRFLVVGKDGIGEEGYMEEMKAYAKELKVHDYIIFTGVRYDIPNIMNTIDLLTVPSLSEPFGLVIAEGMAARKCVVASKVDGIPEVIREGETGFLVPPKSPKKMADKVIYILSNENLRRLMGENAFKRSKELFDLPILAQNIEKLYLSLLN